LSFSLHSLPTTSQARIDVDSDAYHQHVTLSPGREVTIEPPGRRVTIDRVVLPDGCDADGETVRCTVDGRSVAPRMHVRVRVEPRAAVRPEVATHPAAGCGEPTPGSLGAPPVLAPPERRFVVPFGDGQSHRVADVEVSVRSLPDGPDLLWLSVAGEPTEQRSIPFAPNLAGQTLRLGRNLFVARPGDRPAFVVYRTACTRTITASLGAGPHAFWLGSDGVEQIVFEPRAAERSAPHAFSATWSMDRGRAQVSVSRADSYATVFVRPDAVGRSFTLDGARFVVVAIAPRQGTTWADDRWEGGDPIPRLLVGFQVTLSDE
jgi:hypothetical protein